MVWPCLAHDLLATFLHAITTCVCIGPGWIRIKGWMPGVVNDFGAQCLKYEWSAFLVIKMYTCIHTSTIIHIYTIIYIIICIYNVQPYIFAVYGRSRYIYIYIILYVYIYIPCIFPISPHHSHLRGWLQGGHIAHVAP